MPGDLVEIVRAILEGPSSGAHHASMTPYCPAITGNDPWARRASKIYFGVVCIVLAPLSVEGIRRDGWLWVIAEGEARAVKTKYLRLLKRGLA